MDINVSLKVIGSHDLKELKYLKVIKKGYKKPINPDRYSEYQI